MESITIYTNNADDIHLLQELAKRLGATTNYPLQETSTEQKQTDNSVLFARLRNIRSAEGFQSSFEHPIEWQREMRQDKQLLNRE